MCLLYIGLAFVKPLYAEVESLTTPRFNNENWNTIPHPLVRTFALLPNGSIKGETVSGIPFTQYTIMDKDGIRVQRFDIQDHHHFIVQGEVAYSEKELTILLAKYINLSPASL